MALFGCWVLPSSDNVFYVREFNERINSSNAVFSFFQGKASLLKVRNEHFIIFNVRVNPFEPFFYKRLLFFAFSRYLKKKGVTVKPRLLSAKDFGKLLEVFL
jgi:hypothetical protein